MRFEDIFTILIILVASKAPVTLNGPANVDMSGNYTCKATNHFNSVTSTEKFELIVIPTPGAGGTGGSVVGTSLFLTLISFKLYENKRNKNLKTSTFELIFWFYYDRSVLSSSQTWKILPVKSLEIRHNIFTTRYKSIKTSNMFC